MQLSMQYRNGTVLGNSPLRHLSKVNSLGFWGRGVVHRATDMRGDKRLSDYSSCISKKNKKPLKSLISSMTKIKMKRKEKKKKRKVI